MSCILKEKYDAGHNVESAESYNTHVFVVVVFFKLFFFSHFVTNRLRVIFPCKI